ncbi:hypothetical protein V6O07_15455, partial [Arthrospira platensis SPKY2]
KKHNDLIAYEKEIKSICNKWDISYPVDLNYLLKIFQNLIEQKKKEFSEAQTEYRKNKSHNEIKKEYLSLIQDIIPGLNLKIKECEDNLTNLISEFDESLLAKLEIKKQLTDEATR